MLNTTQTLNEPLRLVIRTKEDGLLKQITTQITGSTSGYRTRLEMSMTAQKMRRNE